MTSHRLVCVAAILALTAAACGGGDASAQPVLDKAAAALDTPSGAAATDTTDASASAAGTTDTTDTTDASASTAGTSVSTADAGASTAAGLLVPGDPATGKPDVQLPAELPTELVITDLIEGDGEAIEAGDTATVHYVGVLTADGTEFDNSWDQNQPLPFKVGVGQTIAGFDQGMIGARAGGRRQLDIPPDLAYGDTGAGDVIPPGAALTFVVDVISVEKPPHLGEMADPSQCPAADGSSAQQQQFDAYPPTCIDVTKSYSAEIVTNFGTIVVALDPAKAPLAVNSFVTLARYHYFDGTECHRAIPDFVVQCGDPTATGTGGPGYQFPDELPQAGEYAIGSVAMANSGPDTNGSQFFIITGVRGVALPPSYSLFGEVSEGLDTTVADLNAVANPDNNGVPPLEQILIESVTITES